jgi:hypothetical protein
MVLLVLEPIAIPKKFSQFEYLFFDLLLVLMLIFVEEGDLCFGVTLQSLG